MCFHTHTNTLIHTYTSTHAQTHIHILLTLPVMDDEGPVQGIDGPTPGVGELWIDGQDDVQLRRRKPSLAGGHR